MKKQYTEWTFSFGVSSNNPGQAVPEELCDSLMDCIIEFAEKKGLSVGGGFGPEEPGIEISERSISTNQQPD